MFKDGRPRAPPKVISLLGTRHASYKYTEDTHRPARQPQEPTRELPVELPTRQHEKIVDAVAVDSLSWLNAVRRVASDVRTGCESTLSQFDQTQGDESFGNDLLDRHERVVMKAYNMGGGVRGFERTHAVEAARRLTSMLSREEDDPQVRRLSEHVRELSKRTVDLRPSDPWDWEETPRRPEKENLNTNLSEAQLNLPEAAQIPAKVVNTTAIAPKAISVWLSEVQVRLIPPFENEAKRKEWSCCVKVSFCNQKVKSRPTSSCSNACGFSELFCFERVDLQRVEDDSMWIKVKLSVFLGSRRVQTQMLFLPVLKMQSEGESKYLHRKELPENLEGDLRGKLSFSCFVHTSVGDKIRHPKGVQESRARIPTARVAGQQEETANVLLEYVRVKQQAGARSQQSLMEPEGVPKEQELDERLNVARQQAEHQQRMQTLEEMRARTLKFDDPNHLRILASKREEPLLKTGSAITERYLTSEHNKTLLDNCSILFGGERERDGEDTEGEEELQALDCRKSIADLERRLSSQVYHEEHGQCDFGIDFEDEYPYAVKDASHLMSPGWVQQEDPKYQQPHVRPGDLLLQVGQIPVEHLDLSFRRRLLWGSPFQSLPLLFVRPRTGRRLQVAEREVPAASGAAGATGGEDPKIADQEGKAGAGGSASKNDIDALSRM
ncbi:hypothetical protein GUITHDRAFT_104947 [Guillardia theta CCMP2712]|uniref:Uncharacterized protein n=1 Tax=Guillardia theta (strain CCMP2712) TaxID=905079 RepID=L1JMW6_GUITC|nr:hypothetical protein GUITHDRAFT_104947 [Guillardia theta CCMP2712]EKX49418.1 hypothetical protein GUITHDRAFT_104947 [Guillardia theta CCMP2712]|eukprot:XP_005836398.1 hypothetical protein GUITHDRAFT_104947 [Guillardia theta CCMP2712]